MSRLKKSNKRRILPLLRWGAPRIAGALELRSACPASWQAFRDRIPSSPMPRSTFGESGRGQPAPPNQAVLGERIGGVLTTGRNEPTCRRPQRGDHVPIELDQKNQGPGASPTHTAAAPQDVCVPPLPQIHRLVPDESKARRRPLRNCCSNLADDAFRLPGSARITTR